MIPADRTHWESDGLSQRDRHNAQRAARWMGVWGLTFVAAIVVLGPVPGGMGARPWWAWLLAALPLPPGVMALLAYIRYLREGDELVRKIHVEAAGVGFGVGSVVSIGFYLLAQLVGPWEDSGSFTWLAMWIAYSVALNLARRRYR
jgi:hypothetical protein